MKNKFNFFYALAAFGLLATGCSKEPGDSTPEKNKGEKEFVQLTISSKVLPKTRGSEGDQESATASELAINGATGLKVYVFNEDGSLDYASPGALSLTEQGSGSNVFKSQSFEVTAGNKYFFVFANDPASGGKITAPTAATTMENFQKQAVATTGAGGTLDIAADNNFLLGTLWKGVSLAQGGGTSASPITVNLTVGRLSSKVMLSEIIYSSTNVELKGSFSAGQYRIGTLPRNINTVGVYGGLLEPTNNNVLVTSYVHNAPYYSGNPAAPFNSTDYIQYAVDFKNVGGSNSFYTTENTTARDAVTGQQYFGNTSYIQIETKYTPTPAEVYDPSDLSSGASLTSNTFWTGYKMDGTRLIFNRIPIATDHSDINLAAGFLEYTGGLNYHKFAILDSNESDDVKRFRVLRNHYYEFRVTNFNDLGSHTSDVDPLEPVPTKTTVDIEVSVTDWDKISDDVEV